MDQDDEEEEEEEGQDGFEYSALSGASVSVLQVPQQDDREDGEVRIVTDNLNEMCEFECLLCGMTLVESTLSKHLKVHKTKGCYINPLFPPYHAYLT